MKVANIVSTNKVSISNEFNVVKTMGDIIQGLPTLIIGYDYVNKHYPKFSITNPVLDYNLYWSFKKTENRDKFEEGLNWFIHKVYENLTKGVSYVFVDPIQYNNKTLIKIVRKIKSIKNPITYVHGEMIYIYGETFIFGVDLKLLRYVGINVNKIKDKIKKISNVFMDDSNVFIEYKKNVEMLDNQVRYIPYLYSIINGEDNTASLVHIP